MPTHRHDPKAVAAAGNPHYVEVGANLSFWMLKHKFANTKDRSVVYANMRKDWPEFAAAEADLEGPPYTYIDDGAETGACVELSARQRVR